MVSALVSSSVSTLEIPRCYWTFKKVKLVRNSENSNSDDFKNFDTQKGRPKLESFYKKEGENKRINEKNAATIVKEMPSIFRVEN